MFVPATLLALCATDRPGSPMSHIYFDAERARLYATDGHIVADVPTKDIQTEEVSGLLSTRAVQYATKYTKGRLLRLADHVLVDGVTFPHPPITTPFPDWRAICPERDGRELWIDAENLSLLAQALYKRKRGRLYLTVRWLGSGYPIHVERYKESPDKGHGFIAPLANLHTTTGYERKPTPTETQCQWAIDEAAQAFATERSA